MNDQFTTNYSKKRRIYKNFRMISTSRQVVSGREEFIDLKAAERIDFEGRQVVEIGDTEISRYTNVPDFKGSRNIAQISHV